MAIEFVHEDGSGLVNATSLASEQEANQYFENIGQKDQWTAFTANQRRGALNYASRYMDDVYGHRYLGNLPETTADSQALLWPRENVPNDRGGFYPGLGTELPDPVHRAVAEFALAYLETGSLYGANQEQGPVVTEKEVEVTGAVRKREKFSGGGNVSGFRTFPQAQRHLAPLLTPAQSRVLRA